MSRGPSADMFKLLAPPTNSKRGVPTRFTKVQHPRVAQGGRVTYASVGLRGEVRWLVASFAA